MHNDHTARWILFLGALFLSVVACAIGSSAQEKPAWTANPSVVYQTKGVYPSPVTVRLYFNACKHDDSGKLTSGLDPNATYAVTMTGIGVSISKITPGDCTLTMTLTIDASAQPGALMLTVQDTPTGAKAAKDDGFALFDLMDSTAGPIPANPEVDVLWEVLTDHLCKDNFGNHMPHDLYCVEVKIGNNSAHPLQLAGVGFFRQSPQCQDGTANKSPCTGDPKTGISTPNVSYQTARASAQAGSSTTLRNVLFNGTQAVGLLMASFTPYFTNSFNKGRWATGAAIVSSGITQAINLVAPDQTIREINNLDDQAFRDGKLIPNNTQVRLLVFVQKRSLAEPIGEIVPKIEAANQHDCLTPMEAGYKRLPGVDNKCYPAWEDSLTQCLKKLVCDPVIVKLALGRMIIVGDQIDFIQRVVVDSTVTSQEVEAPGSQAPGVVGKSAVPSITATGTGQTAKINTAFAKPLVVTVKDSTGKPMSDVTVTFTAPDGGPSGTFAGGSKTDGAMTDANGVATSSTFTANGTAGGPYNVTATVEGVVGAVNFSLTNNP
jgi:hypothetical protein